MYFLGDLSSEGYTRLVLVLKRIKGIKHIILGNHDMWFVDDVNIFNNLKKIASIETVSMIRDGDKKVFLCHYPIMDWPEIEQGGYHLYGHIHNKIKPQIKEYYKDKLAFNVSSDVLQHEPKTLEELVALKEANKNETFVN